MLNKKYFIGCLAIISILSSCKKNEYYDIKGNPTTKFFTNNESAGNAPQNSITYNVVNIPAGTGISNLSTTFPTIVKFPVFATKAVGGDVTINAELDNSLIAAYNTARNTNYVAFPANFLNTSGLAAHILNGSTRSADSITITPDLTLLNTLTDSTYMAPIKLTTVSNPEMGQITENTATQITYIIARVEQRKIKFLAVAADALGTLITPRTAWTTIFNPAPTTVGNIFDGSTTTFNRWVASPVQVDLNMQTTQNVTGIRLHTSTSATYVPTQVDVYLSNDGVNYTLMGSPLKANLTYATYNYILFYKAYPAKYVRLMLYYVTNTNSQNYRITELDVYAN